MEYCNSQRVQPRPHIPHRVEQKAVDPGPFRPLCPSGADGLGRSGNWKSNIGTDLDPVGPGAPAREASMAERTMSGVKPDEAALWDLVTVGFTPRTAGVRIGMHPKRVIYLCEKWATQGCYDYGVTADLGWMVADDPDDSGCG